jgi:hypothetical protein
MERMRKTSKIDFTTPPDNAGVSYEDIKKITQERHSADYIGENDIA